MSSDTSGDIAGLASGAVREAKDLASAAGEAVKDEAKSFRSYATDKMSEVAEEKKQAAAETIGEFANAIRRAADDLSGRDRSAASQLVGKAADGLERFSRAMAEKRPEELLESARSFGRRNPGTLLFTSVLVGMAVGRVLRSSAPASKGDGRSAGGTSAADPSPALSAEL